MKTFLRCFVCAFLFTAFFIISSQTAASMASEEQSETRSEPYEKGLTTGRIRSLAGVGLGLLSVVIGWRTSRRATAVTSGLRNRAIAGLVLGMLAVVLSGLHLSNTIGGFGTGGGKAGAIVGLVLGLLGTAIGGLALRKKR